MKQKIIALMIPDSERALLHIDISPTFMPGGELPVEGGDQIVPVANKNSWKFGLIVATQDWHPAGHISFASRFGKNPYGETIITSYGTQGLWPDHGLQGSEKANLHPELETTKFSALFRKGMRVDVDSHSAFNEADEKDTGLAGYLKGRGVRHVFLDGLATNICVMLSALDAVQHGFNVFVIIDACRGVDMSPGDVQASIDRMRAKNIHIITSDQIPQEKLK